MKRPQVKISIPDVLKVQLIDDWEAITKNSQVSMQFPQCSTWIGADVFVIVGSSTSNAYCRSNFRSL
jgi:hypothetical protein